MSEKKTRRRGEALEQAILIAGWDVLGEFGWEGFTMDAVARRAGTAKAVLYRRWPSRVELARDVLDRVVAVPGHRQRSRGSLRADLLRFAKGVSDVLSQPYGEALRVITAEGDLSGRGSPVQSLSVAAFSRVISAAIARGELSAEPKPMVANVGTTMLVYDFLQTGAPPTDDTIESIVDDVWLPLLQNSR